MGQETKTKSSTSTLDWKVTSSLILGFLSVLISLTSPRLYIQTNSNSSSHGNKGEKDEGKDEEMLDEGQKEVEVVRLNPTCGDCFCNRARHTENNVIIIE